MIKQSIDSYSIHEAMHTTYIHCDMVGKYICEHPAIKDNLKWKKKAEKAALLLAELYQEIGQLAFDMDEDRCNTGRPN
jgi:hypothetical protein